MNVFVCADARGSLPDEQFEGCALAGAAAAASAVLRAARLTNRHVPIVGLGIFNAYAVKAA